MKKILSILAFCLICFFGNAQSYISTSADMKFDGGLKSFASPNMFVIGTYNPIIQVWTAIVRVQDSSSFDLTGDEYTLIFTKAEVDAFTGTGTGDTAIVQNALEQTVVDYLENINGPIFTIN